MQMQTEVQPFRVQLSWLAGAPVVQINVDALTAKRRVSGWAGGQVAHSCRGSTPTLVFNSDHAYWRVPVELTRQGVGVVGEIGVVIVDAATGALDANESLAQQMQVAAQALASSLNTAPFAHA